MKQIYRTLGLSLLIGMAATTANAQVASDDNDDGVTKINSQLSSHDYREGEVLVKFKDYQPVEVRRNGRRFASTSVSRLTQVLEKYGTEEMEQLVPLKKGTVFKARRAKAPNGGTIVERDLSQLYRVRLSEEHAPEVLRLVDELKQVDEVEYAEPNYILHTLEAEEHIADSYNGNPYVSNQWYLETYGVKQLWNKPVINSKRPVIAIIDTGVDMTHPDLVDNLWTNEGEVMGEKGYDNDGNGFKNDLHGWDFINNTPNVRDFNMHGTHVAGIAAASNNNIGIVGANPRALIMPVSVMQSDGTGDVGTIIKGINYAVENGATVLNLSLGTYANSSALRQALERAYQDAVIVAAAGNDGKYIDSDCGMRPMPMFPAAYSFVLGVQATTQGGGLAGFSNYDCNGPNYSAASTLQDPDGFNYEMKAPGTEMYSTIPGGKYKTLNGTSMAAPLVAGAISALTMVKDYSKGDGIHQEILWGDLTHSDNILEAYNLTDRPAELDVVNMQFQDRKELADESEEDYSGDREIDAGETVSIYPVIRTTFGSASNIKMHLEMGDEFEDVSTVEILNGADNKVDFGMNLDAYGRGVSLNPLKFTVPATVADNRHIKLKLVATCDESTESVEMPFTIVVTNMVKISGLITEDRTLTADHVYLVNDNLAIAKGAKLTIEPGTRLEFAESTRLNSFGKLDAHGTPEKPIVFTRHIGGGKWYGVYSHQDEDPTYYDGIYTNAERTLFTILPTEQTPNRISFESKRVYLSSTDETPKNFYIEDYLGEIYQTSTSSSVNLTPYKNRLTDPDFITPFVLRMQEELSEYCKQFSDVSTDEKPIGSQINIYYSNKGWVVVNNPKDTISYCRIEDWSVQSGSYTDRPIMEDCIIKNTDNGYVLWDLAGVRNVIEENKYLGSYDTNSKLKYTNIVNNIVHYESLCRYSHLHNNNYFNNAATYISSGKYKGKEYWLYFYSPSVQEDKAEEPSYLGTSRADIVRPHIYEMGNCPNNYYGVTNLDNMPTRPYAEAHGIVWKVCVNGKDAQDEYEDLAPLGVGRHKFEVYFNRPMNKAVAPSISFGVRDPYTQNAVNEDGSWNDEGTIYTAYKTITGKTKSDGVNRIYVYGAEDNEYFEIPYEKSRFNINVQAAGSMATGFMAEANLGRVDLTWHNEGNNFDDAMGFNIYRYSYVEKDSLDRYGRPTGVKVVVPDTVRINTDIVDIETTRYTDYDVTPGTTYYYMYKVLSTDLQEYDVSNVVAATPQTATKGDANGDTEVDVSDVVTTVNYIVGETPRPFIFEAADMNSDTEVDVLDVIDIVQAVLNPAGARMTTMAEATAVYTVEDGMLYVETPVALAGLQVQTSTDVARNETLAPAAGLKGFEQASCWLTDNDYRLLLYSFGKTLAPGKHAIMTVGDAELTQLRLADAQGRQVQVVAGGATTVKDAMGSKVKRQKGIYNLNGQKLGSDQLRRGVYIINGEKVVK